MVRKQLLPASIRPPTTASSPRAKSGSQVYRCGPRRQLARRSLYDWHRRRRTLRPDFHPGPDGAVYSINGGTGVRVGQPFQRGHRGLSPRRRTFASVVVGQSISFAAVVTNFNGSGPVPTGSVTFFDEVFYLSLTAHTNTLATVALSNGVASVSTAALVADGTNNGCHFITASYTGDTNFPAGAATLVQKIHAYASSTTLTPSTASNAVIFTAKVYGGGASCAGSDRVCRLLRWP